LTTEVDAQVDCIIIANATMAFTQETVFNAAAERALRLKSRLENGAAGREPCRFGLKQFAWRP
jgi:hypothetical protein